MRRLSNHVYECLEKCGYKLIAASNRDGMSCADCGSPMYGIREAKPGEKIGWSREPKPKKVSIDDKLKYLDLVRKIGNPERIKRVCNSIEKDLGLSDDYDVLDTRTMDGKGGLVKVPIGNMYDPSVLTEMWESEHVAIGRFVPDGAYVKPSEEDAITDVPSGGYVGLWKDIEKIGEGIKEALKARVDEVRNNGGTEV